MAEIFHRDMKQAVLLFGSDTWVILAAMDRTVADTLTGFMRQIMGKRARRKTDGTWVTPRVEIVQKAAVTQSGMTYIGRRQSTVAQWVVLHPSFGLFSRETGYEGRRHRRNAWWSQEAAETQIRATLEEILREDRRR